MKVKDLIDLIGAYEKVIIRDEDYNKLVQCEANCLNEEIGEKFIRTIYTSNGQINIVALDKRRRKWYNRNGNIGS